MKKTQRLINIYGDSNQILIAKQIVKGFKAVTLTKNVTDSSLSAVFHFNKNAVHFGEVMDYSLGRFNPINIQLTNAKTDLERSLLSVHTIIEDFPLILDKYNVDCGDHSSHDSTGMCKQSTDKCLLCRIKDRKTDKIEHILYENDNFYVVPGTGAFFEGYIMIVPKMHVMSFANLPEEQLEEFFMIYQNLSSMLEQIYGKKVFGFECSSGKTGEGKHETSIIHAHFHMAVTDMPVISEVLDSGLTPQLIEMEDLKNYGDDPYMLYVSQDNSWYISCDNHEYYPRQHPRQVLAHWMSTHDLETVLKNMQAEESFQMMSETERNEVIKKETFYNWRNYPLRKRMDEIATEIRTFAKANLHLLPNADQSAIRFED